MRLTVSCHLSWGHQHDWTSRLVEFIREPVSLVKSTQIEIVMINRLKKIVHLRIGGKLCTVLSCDRYRIVECNPWQSRRWRHVPMGSAIREYRKGARTQSEQSHGQRPDNHLKSHGRRIIAACLHFKVKSAIAEIFSHFECGNRGLFLRLVEKKQVG